MASVQPQQALHLDQSQQLSFVRYFRTLPEKPNTTVRFFNRIDYYTLHGDDAYFAAREVFKSTANVKCMGSEPNKLDYVVLNKGNFEIFLRELLLIKLYRVEVYINQGSLKSNEWVLEYKGSPGNLSQFEDILFWNSDIMINPTIVAVKTSNDGKNKTVGVVCVDSNEHTFSVAEFTDNEHYSELEALIIQLGPKECLLQQSEHDFKLLNSIMERSHVIVTQRKKADFDNSGLVQDLNRLLYFAEGQQNDANSYSELNMNLVCGCLNATVKYLNLTSDESVMGKFTFKKLDSMRYVHLDSAALNALNVLPKKEILNANSKIHSIVGLLDRCRTSHGKRLISQWVRQPLRDVNQIQERLDIVESFILNSEVRQQIHEDHIRRIPDFQMLTRKLLRNKANLQDCYKIFQAIERIPYLVDCLRKCDNKSVTGAIIDPIADVLIDLEKYQQMIESTIDMNLVDRGEFLVKPSFDEELQELSDKMKSVESSVQNQLNRAARDLGLDAGKTIKLDCNSLLGYHFRITLKEEPILRKNKSYTVLDAIKGGVRFRNDKLTNLNDEYLETKASYEDHQKNVVSEIIRIAAGYSEILLRLSDIMAKLDVLLSFSIVSCQAPIPYIRPNIVPSGSRLTLTKARHPCLELQDGVSYIANDVHFQEDESTFYIITGPNMGGKSTYIRSIGVCCLLAHIGCFVPCEEATVPLLDSILARVGADDCQTKGLSTFMLEMIETAAILRTATKNSLVIIDELGRGTSTFEGCGIAWAIAEHLATNVKAFCLFATHFHEITQLEQTTASVKNLHVTAVTQQNQLALLYQVKPGICDKSFGIHVAKMADFPPNIVKYAEEKQHQLESHRFDMDNNDIPNKAQVKKEAEAIIVDFIKACQKLNTQELSDSEIQSKISYLKQVAVNHDNPFIKTLLDK